MDERLPELHRTCTATPAGADHAWRCGSMNERILIAEDERWTRQLLTKVLEREGLVVVACGDGAEALEWIRSNRFEAVVLDVMLPHVSGCEILAECPSIPEPRPVFFVMIAFDVELAEAIAPGLVAAVLRKPFDVTFLADVIRETVRASA